MSDCLQISKVNDEKNAHKNSECKISFSKQFYETMFHKYSNSAADQLRWTPEVSFSINPADWSICPLTIYMYALEEGNMHTQVYACIQQNRSILSDLETSLYIRLKLATLGVRYKINIHWILYINLSMVNATSLFPSTCMLLISQRCYITLSIKSTCMSVDFTDTTVDLNEMLHHSIHQHVRLLISQTLL